MTKCYSKINYDRNDLIILVLCLGILRVFSGGCLNPIHFRGSGEHNSLLSERPFDRHAFKLVIITTKSFNVFDLKLLIVGLKDVGWATFDAFCEIDWLALFIGIINLTFPRLYTLDPLHLHYSYGFDVLIVDTHLLHATFSILITAVAVGGPTGRSTV